MEQQYPLQNLRLEKKIESLLPLGSIDSKALRILAAAKWIIDLKNVPLGAPFSIFSKRNKALITNPLRLAAKAIAQYSLQGSAIKDFIETEIPLRIIKKVNSNSSTMFFKRACLDSSCTKARDNFSKASRREFGTNTGNSYKSSYCMSFN